VEVTGSRLFVTTPPLLFTTHADVLDQILRRGYQHTKHNAPVLRQIRSRSKRSMVVVIQRTSRACIIFTAW
jgi:hypothetical protein